METYLLLLNIIAMNSGIDPNLVHSIIKQESNFNEKAIGKHDEIGLMQVRPKYSKYKRKDLFNPRINIEEGVRILKEAKEGCKHKEDNTFLVCYNKGVTGGSKVKYPKKDKYYKKVMKFYGQKVF